MSNIIYLGSLLDKSSTSSKEIERLVGSVEVIGQLQKPLWNQPSDAVLSTILYGCLALNMI